MNIICLDTETTGFRKDDEVLQLARHSKLFKPKDKKNFLG